MIRVLLIAFAVICILPVCGQASDRYFLNDQPVLLYKVINWWYDAEPETAQQICGDKIRYVGHGKLQLSYNANSTVNTMQVDVAGGFAALLSPVRQCADCPLQYQGSAIWLNRKYFEGNVGQITVEELQFQNSCRFSFANVTRGAFQELSDLGPNLAVVLDAEVRGLTDGRIVLYDAADTLGKCAISGLRESTPRSPDIILQLIDSSHDEVVASFQLGQADILSGNKRIPGQ